MKKTSVKTMSSVAAAFAAVLATAPQAAPVASSAAELSPAADLQPSATALMQVEELLATVKKPPTKPTWSEVWPEDSPFWEVVRPG